MSTNKIILVRGIQGSGKSTLAKKLVSEHPNYVRINRDDIRAMMCTPWSYKLEKVVIDTQISIIKNAFKREYTPIIDDVSNLNSKTINRFKSILPGVDIVYIDDCLSTPLDVCIERDSHRDNPIGKAIITDTYNKYKDIIDNINC